MKIVHRGSYCSFKSVLLRPPNKRTNLKTSLTSAGIIFVIINAFSNQLCCFFLFFFSHKRISNIIQTRKRLETRIKGAHVNTLAEIQRAGNWQGCRGNCTIKAQEDALCMGQEERERFLWVAQVRVLESSTLTSISI